MKKMMVREKELLSLAKDIVKTYPFDRVFGFFGEMGAGKTTLIKELCKVLQVEDQTSSPTFAIVNEYHTSAGEPVYHFDFYRIDKVDELRQIGLEEYLHSGSYCFMEWTEKAEEILNGNYVKIRIECEEDGSRIVYY